MPRFDPHPARRPVVVTGASSGIGAAVAEAFASVGHPVLLGARRIDRLEELAQRIVREGGEARAVVLDLADPVSIARFSETAEAWTGGVEVLVSNAGDVQPIDTVGPHAEFARQLEVNLLGAQHLASELVPAMIGRGRGDVVFVTSEVAVRPRTHMAGYVASKAALEGFVAAMAMECEGTGVRVGMVRPGPVGTEQGSTWDGEDVAKVIDSWTRWGLMRHGGMLRPPEVADAVLAMATVPKGTRYALIEVQPEAPVSAEPAPLLALHHLDDSTEESA
ncbi:MAG: SDR family oxidoreductase [Microthrixaceae bacterium]